MTEQAENRQPIGKVIIFDLPFHINVKDGINDTGIKAWHEAYLRGDGASAFSPYAPHPAKPQPQAGFGDISPVHLPTEPLDESYKVMVPGLGSVYELTFLRRLNQITQSQMPGDVLGDRAGRYSYSSVEVKVYYGNIKEEFRDDDFALSDLAVYAVNWFLEHYRVITKRYYISQITPGTIGDFHVSTMYSNSSFRQWRLRCSLDGPVIFANTSLSQEKEENLRAAIVQENEPAITQVLYLEAEEKLSLRQWRLAIIEAAILFETWLGLHVRFLFKQQGLSKEDVEKKFINKSGSHLFAKDIAGKLIQEAASFNFKATNEYTDWHEGVAKLRNAVVHGDTFRVEPQAAIDAFNKVKAAITLVEKNTPRSDNQEKHPTLYEWIEVSTLSEHVLVKEMSISVRK